MLRKLGKNDNKNVYVMGGHGVGKTIFMKIYVCGESEIGS